MECLQDVADGRIDLVVERIECDAVSLTTVTQDNFVVIDEQAAQVLNAQSRSGPLYKIYRATKSLIVSPSVVSLNDAGYDTTSWEDVNKIDDRDQDYIDAMLAAEKVRGGISSKFSGISGYTYEVCKFKIVESKGIENGTPIRDYFLKIMIGAPSLKYVFAQVHETDDKKLTLVNDYLRSSPE